MRITLLLLVLLGTSGCLSAIYEKPNVGFWEKQHDMMYCGVGVWELSGQLEQERCMEARGYEARRN